MTGKRSILHVDLDSFFVGCERLRRSELVGVPVVVAGGKESWPGDRREPGRAVVSAASYEARGFGVHSAMPLARAFATCAELVAIPVDIDYYREISGRVFEVLRDYATLLEPGSLDEGYLDISSTLAVQHRPLVQVAAEIRERIQAELGLSCSVGGGTSKTIAKIASGYCKPHGVAVIKPGREAHFLAPLGVGKLPGIGPKTEELLTEMGVVTLGELVQVGREGLVAKLGKRGLDYWRRAQGIDDAPVAVPEQQQSISREETFATDQTSLVALEHHLQRLSADLGAKLRREGLVAGGVVVKLRNAQFVTTSRQATLEQLSAADVKLFETARSLLRKTWTQGQAIRLLGVAARDIKAAEGSTSLSAQDHLDAALDLIRAKYGEQAIRRAGVG